MRRSAKKLYREPMGDLDAPLVCGKGASLGSLSIRFNDHHLGLFVHFWLRSKRL